MGRREPIPGGLDAASLPLHPRKPLPLLGLSTTRNIHPQSGASERRVSPGQRQSRAWMRFEATTDLAPIHPCESVFSSSSVMKVKVPVSIFVRRARSDGLFYAAYVQPRIFRGVGGAVCRCFLWWPGRESNPRHEDFQSSALPTELSGLTEARIKINLSAYVNTFTCFLLNIFQFGD